MTMIRVAPPLPQEVDLAKTYDAVIVGSGAAGGMAAHVLTAHGMQVLLLEAGKKIPIEQELRSMQWPYEHPRRGDYDFKAKSHDGYGEDWPISYADLAPYYDKVDLYLGISGVKENLPHLPDSLFQRPTKLNIAEAQLRERLKAMGRVVTPYRAGVTTDGVKHNKYRSKCFGRGACNRRPGGCDIHAAFDSPTGLIYPAMDTGRLTLRTNSTAYEVLVDRNTGRARGVAFVDSEDRKSYEAKAKVVILAASTLESARLLLLSRSRQHPNGIGNSSGHVGHNFCEHVMGPGVTGLVKDMIGKPPTLDDGRPGGFYIPRFRNLKDKQPGFVRGYGFEGGSGFSIFPDSAWS